jgi:hypothetical protein
VEGGILRPVFRSGAGAGGCACGPEDNRVRWGAGVHAALPLSLAASTWAMRARRSTSLLVVL